MQRSYSFGISLIATMVVSIVVLGACNRTEPTPTVTPPPPTVTAKPAATATMAPTEAPTPTEPSIAIDPDAARATLRTLLLNSLAVSVPVTSGVGIESVHAFPLETAAGAPLWLAHTTGVRSFDPEQAHVMALYTPADPPTGGDWDEVARQEFSFDGAADGPTFSPDYLGEGSVSQVQIEPEQLWVQVEGGVGAHSGVYGLFAFDGEQLTEQLNGFSSSPGLGRIEDLNNDGLYEVLLDASDYYVFCYACGVRAVQWEIHRWDGTQMVPVRLEPLSDDAPAAVRSFNERLIALAEAGLWQDAESLLDEAATFSYTEPTLSWNLAHVRLNAAERAAEATNESAYPLLSKIFYGDYGGAVELMRTIGADGLFIPETELLTETVAANWQVELSERIITNATAALQVNPDLAAAYFVRGWGHYLQAFDEAAAVPDLQEAVALAPTDQLFTKSLKFVTE